MRGFRSGHPGPLGRSSHRVLAALSLSLALALCAGCAAEAPRGPVGGSRVADPPNEQSTPTAPAPAPGIVWAWGDDDSGQLGDGVRNWRGLNPLPARAGGMADAVMLAAGQGHSLAVAADGTVWAWGDNTYGQFGDGTRTDRVLPVQVGGLRGVTAVAAGSRHS